MPHVGERKSCPASCCCWQGAGGARGSCMVEELHAPACSSASGSAPSAGGHSRAGCCWWLKGVAVMPCMLACCAAPASGTWRSRSASPGKQQTREGQGGLPASGRAAGGGERAKQGRPAHHSVPALVRPEDALHLLLQAAPHALTHAARVAKPLQLLLRLLRRGGAQQGVQGRAGLEGRERACMCSSARGRARTSSGAPSGGGRVPISPAACLGRGALAGRAAAPLRLRAAGAPARRRTRRRRLLVDAASVRAERGD
jgi:hypothetical protein